MDLANARIVRVRRLLRLLVLPWLLLLPADISWAQDADTIKVDGKRYRLDGIDAPEIDQQCLDAEGALYRCGQAAADALQAFIARRPVHCEDLGVDPDFNQRRIGRCSVSATDLHLWLVREGWALNFEPNAKGRFKTAEDDARAVGLGLWRGCFIEPRDFRRWNKGTAKLLGVSCPLDARERLFPDEPSMPFGCEIKGKLSARAWPYEGIYHLPGCGSYRRTTKPERWFCSQEDAIAAGFRSSFTCWLR